MQKVLMTWYGITDLRASLGLEYSNGPILSALMAEEYKEVLILGYTNKDKINIDESNFEKDLQIAKEAFAVNDQAKVWGFINQYANTEIAHKNFVEWLQDKLKKMNTNTEVIFHSVRLDKLNDTEGIYDVAVKALDVVASFNSKREVTFYLSPGTPVMAFVWAFVALRHPSLEKRLIASPIMNKPPEVVSLPSEWLEWHGRQVSDSGKHITEYDIVFHLFGEQRMPSLLGILQFESKKHVFINSEQYPAEVMKQFIGNSEFDEIMVDPFNPIEVKDDVMEYLKQFPANLKIGFNLTGGTKLMYAGALAACKKINATPFYFDSRHDQIIFLDDFNSADTKDIESVETFFKLHGNDLHISNRGLWKDIPGIDDPQRKKLTQVLWSNRSDISKFYRNIISAIEDDRPFEFTKGKIKIVFTKNKKVGLNIKGEIFTFDKWSSFGQYITGGWFEEYTYLQFEPLMKAGIIKDLRIGFEIAFKDAEKSKNALGFEQLRNIAGEPYQELDVVFTDGKKLYIVECKAGYMKVEYVMKLQNIVRYFGGSAGKGILAACFSPSNKITKKKIEDASNIKLLSGRSLKKDLNKMFNF